MISDFAPPSTDSDHACGSVAWRVVMPSRATAPIEGSASPRKPSVRIRKQILVVELGGGVTVDGERQIGVCHAAAVVGDADAATSAAIGENIDPAGAGIDGVFDQFLDHARWALHHLAGGDAVDELFRELADGHGSMGSSI